MPLMMRTPLVFDLETVPMEGAADYLPTDFKAPDNYKDQAKIEAHIAAQRAAALDKAALDVDLLEIAALGFCWPGLIVQTIDRSQSSEAGMLAEFWDTAAAASGLVGFNILGFDLPALIRRSQYLGVKVPLAALNIDRFRTPHVDLMLKLSFDGKLTFRKLDFFCKRFAITAGSGDVITGAEIGAAVAAGEWDKVRGHVRADVEKTAALAWRLGYTSAPANFVSDDVEATVHADGALMEQPF